MSQPLGNIVICEPFCDGMQHVPFNRAMIDIVQQAFPGAHVDLLASASHLEALAIDDAVRVSQHVIELPALSTPDWRRFAADYRTVRRATTLARDGVVLFTSAIAPTLFAAKIVASPDTRTYAVMHGYLNEIVGWRSRNPLRRATDLRSALQWRAKTVQIMVLEQPIEASLLRTIPALEGTVHTLPHPVPQDAVPSGGLESPVKIGFLGLATEAKGYRQFQQIAREAKALAGDKLEFHAIGRLPPNTPPGDTSALTTKPSEARLPRETYRRAVEAMHYICLPFQGSHYDLSASGVLLDAVGFGKPLLALKTPIAEHLLSQFPNAGRLFDSLDALRDWIVRGALAPNVEQYRQAQEAMQATRTARSPSALALQFRRMIDQSAQAALS